MALKKKLSTPQIESSVLRHDILTDTLVSVFSKACFGKVQIIFGNQLQCP